MSVENRHSEILLKAVATAGLLLVPIVAHAQTTIVVVKRGGELVVAADSKVVDETGRVKPNINKVINLGGNTFAAFAGLANAPADVFSSISIPESIRDCGKQASGLSETTRICENTLMGVLQEYVQELQMKPDLYSELENKPLLEIVFFGSVRGSPSFSLVKYLIGKRPSPVADAPISLSQTDCGEDCGKAGVRLEILGHRAAADRMLRGRPDYWETGLVNGARGLVQAEIDDPIDSKWVGPPISIVKVTASGVELNPHGEDHVKH